MRSQTQRLACVQEEERNPGVVLPEGARRRRPLVRTLCFVFFRAAGGARCFVAGGEGKAAAAAAAREGAATEPSSDPQHLQLVGEADAHPVGVRRAPLQLVDLRFGGVRQDRVHVPRAALQLPPQRPDQRLGVLAFGRGGEGLRGGWAGGRRVSAKRAARQQERGERAGERGAAQRAAGTAQGGAAAGAAR